MQSVAEMIVSVALVLFIVTVLGKSLISKTFVILSIKCDLLYYMIFVLIRFMCNCAYLLICVCAYSRLEICMRK